jgi:hypothetical protein
MDTVRDTLKSYAERVELIQLMCAIEILNNPIPAAMEEVIENWARQLHVEERALIFLREVAHGEIKKAATDFYRLKSIGNLSGQM